MISPRASAASSPPSDDVRGGDQRPHPVRRHVEAAAGDAVAEHVVIEPADDVLPGDPAGTLRIERAPSALDPDHGRPAARSRRAGGPPDRVPTTRSARRSISQEHPRRVERRVRVGGDRAPSRRSRPAHRGPARRGRPPTARPRRGRARRHRQPTRHRRVTATEAAARTSTSAGERRQAPSDTTTATRTATAGSPPRTIDAARRTDAAADDRPSSARPGRQRRLCRRAGRSARAGVPPPVTHDRPRLRRSAVVPDEDPPVRAAARPRRARRCWGWWPSPCSDCSTDGRAAGLG